MKFAYFFAIAVGNRDGVDGGNQHDLPLPDNICRGKGNNIQNKICALRIILRKTKWLESRSTDEDGRLRLIPTSIRPCGQRDRPMNGGRRMDRWN